MPAESDSNAVRFVSAFWVTLAVGLTIPVGYQMLSREHPLVQDGCNDSRNSLMWQAICGLVPYVRPAEPWRDVPVSDGSGLPGYGWVEPVTQWVDNLITGWAGVGGSNSGGARAGETTGSLLVSNNGSARNASPHRAITSPLPHNQLRATEENERRNPSAGAKIPPTVTLLAIAALNEQTLSLPQPESIIFTELDQERASEFLLGGCSHTDCGGAASSLEPGERGMEPIFVSVPAVPPAALVLASELAPSARASLSLAVDALRPEPVTSIEDAGRLGGASSSQPSAKLVAQEHGLGPQKKVGMVPIREPDPSREARFDKPATGKGRAASGTTGKTGIAEDKPASGKAAASGANKTGPSRRSADAASKRTLGPNVSRAVNVDRKRFQTEPLWSAYSGWTKAIYGLSGLPIGRAAPFEGPRSRSSGSIGQGPKEGHVASSGSTGSRGGGGRSGSSGGGDKGHTGDSGGGGGGNGNGNGNGGNGNGNGNGGGGNGNGGGGNGNGGGGNGGGGKGGEGGR